MSVTDGAQAQLASAIDLEPDDMRRGLGRLLLTVAELIRELLERQAVRRVERGTLDAVQIDDLGRGLASLAAEIDRLREHFGLAPEDLDLDLGPLGRLF